MKNWILAALVLGVPVTSFAKAGGWGRCFGISRPAPRSVSATRIQAPLIRARAPVVHVPASRAVFRDSAGGASPNPVPTPAPIPTPPPTPAPPQPPAHFQSATQEGRIIRALGYTAQQTNDGHAYRIESGDKISLEPDKASQLSGVGAGMGKPDKLPPPNPGGNGTASGRNAITKNNSDD